MSFTFPYQYGYIDHRKIPYPIVIVELQTIRGKRPFAFIMDTGADDTTLPHYMIKLLNINTDNLQTGKAQGIGRQVVKTLEGNISITFCKQTFTIPCSFTKHNEAPFLLGKEGIFNRFNIKFDNDKQVSVFEERT